jgi:uncharacterized membrane-anchored protein
MKTVRFAVATGIVLAAAGVWADAPPEVPAEAPAEAPADAPADAPEKSPFADINFQDGPLEGKLEDIATVKVGEGMAFISGRAESAKFIEATQNLVSKQEVGIIVSAVEGQPWWVSFEFDPIGYVKDDDQEELDPDAMLEALQQGTEQGNELRRQRGWEELHVEGWHTPPRYNPTTHNLEWATRLRSANGSNVNYNVRLLGRRGVMSVTLIAQPETLDVAVAKLQGLVGGFGYKAEQSYAAYEPGDKIAEYGLTALVVGGALAVAAKSGLLGKFWKLILAAVVALGAGARTLFGRKKKAEPPPEPHV